jgi:hypothetical protein
METAFISLNTNAGWGGVDFYGVTGRSGRHTEIGLLVKKNPAVGRVDIVRLRFNNYYPASSGEEEK